MSKIGRNEPCKCGSGKKHKRCCLTTTPTVLFYFLSVVEEDWTEEEQREWRDKGSVFPLVDPDTRKILRFPSEEQAAEFAKRKFPGCPFEALPVWNNGLEFFREIESDTVPVEDF